MSIYPKLQAVSVMHHGIVDSITQQVSVYGCLRSTQHTVRTYCDLVVRSVKMIDRAIQQCFDVMVVNECIAECIQRYVDSMTHAL